jgi:hypothetical protein
VSDALFNRISYSLTDNSQGRKRRGNVENHRQGHQRQ